MGKRLITTLLVLLTIGVQAFAQSAVSGKVTDEAGEPCVGANVLIKGTTTGTMTYLDGNYSLTDVRKGAILVFSSIGYTSQEVRLGSSSVVNVVLKSDADFLNQSCQQDCNSVTNMLGHIAGHADGGVKRRKV